MEKIHHKQNAFFADPSRNRWIFGGNRTGKTHAGAVEAVRWATEKQCEGWVVSLSTQVQRDVAQRKIVKLLEDKDAQCEYVMLKGKADRPERGVIDFITVTNEKGSKSRIGFKTCEQGREKFQGTSLDWVWFDEEPGEDIYEECLLRTMDRGGSVWGTMTPLKGRTWVYQRIYMALGSDISVHCMTWDDNPYLEKTETALMERNCSEDSLESRKYGRFTEGTGLVFKEFSEENIVKNVSFSSQKKNWVYTGISIDPGYTNPTAVLWFALDGDSNIFVVADYKESGQSVEQISRKVINKSNELGVPIKNVFIDSAATAQTLGEPQSVADQFRANGIPVNTKVDKNVHDGLHRVKALLRSADGVRKLFIYENCTHLLKELKSYFWADNEKPHKSNDHCIDALRYFVMSAYVDTPKQKTTEFDKHKRRIIHEKI